MTNCANSYSMTLALGVSTDDIFLTEKELATRHRRSQKTLRNDRVKGGYTPFVKIGRQVRYRFSEVIAYERACRVSCRDCPTTTADLCMETFLTPRELAHRHSRYEKTLRNDRVDHRYVSYYKLGGQIRYALSDVLAYEQAHRLTSTSAAARTACEMAPSHASIS